MSTQIDEQVARTHTDSSAIVSAPPQSGTEALCAPAGQCMSAALAYIHIARPDHWFKNVFMLVGVLLAWLYSPIQLEQFHLEVLALGLISVCLVASSNYVINEILDAPCDLGHPTKRNRPIPSGLVSLPLAYAEWILLGVVGLVTAAMVNWPFFIAASLLLVMGLIYNIPPLRTKDVPYLDVLSEAVNNPLRLALGWFLVIPQAIPPLSLVVAYWMVGAFFMATKRFAEYRSLGDADVAGAYRKSFVHYTQERLLVSMFIYTAAAALFLGVFVIRYHLELILSTPLIAGFFGYYLMIAFKQESAVQSPERLYREKGLMGYLFVCLVVFLGLMLVEIPAMYNLFNVDASRLPALWRL